MTIPCPHCGNDDESMLEEIGFVASKGDGGVNILFRGIPVDMTDLHLKRITYLCVNCSKEFTVDCN